MKVIPKTRSDAQGHFITAMVWERRSQDEKWGVQIHLGHTWCAILGEEFGELCAAVNEERWSDAERELVQIAAVACAAYEQSRIDQALDPQWGQCKQTPAEALMSVWPAAKAALDELIESEREEWVHLGIGIFGKGLRISRDGQRLEIEFLDGTWHTANDHYPAADGYRAGLQVRDEAVRELVEAVLSATEQKGNGCSAALTYPSGYDWPCIREAAKRVRL